VTTSDHAPGEAINADADVNILLSPPAHAPPAGERPYNNNNNSGSQHVQPVSRSVMGLVWIVWLGMALVGGGRRFLVWKAS
jgi:hypothetical protein